MIQPDVQASRREKIARCAVLAVLFVYALSVFVPWRPQFPGSELDSSWAMMLHWARIHRLQFGKDLVFTYGPWGFVMAGYHAATYWSMIAAWTLFSAVFVWAIFRISQRLSHQLWIGAIWMAAVIALAGHGIHLIQDLRLYLLCCTLALLHFYVDRRTCSAVKIAIVIAIAWGSLGKFSILFIAVAMLLMVSTEQLLRRRAPWYVLIFTGAYLVGWLAAAQHLANLPAYFRTSLEISRTYDQSESLTTPTEAADVGIYLLMAGALHAIVAMAHWRDRRTLLLTQAGLGVVSLLLFKVGYVRHDGHELVASLGLAVLTLLYGASVWPRIQTRTPRTLLGALLLTSLAMVWSGENHWEGKSLPLFTWETLSHFPERAQLAWSWLSGHPKAEAIYQADLSSFRAVHPMPPIDGSVDTYSWNQSAVLANELDYHPRPIPQSYLAFSTALAAINAQFLRSPEAPENILMEIQAIDGHLPAQEDSLSWPELLTRYDLKDASQKILVMQRITPRREYSVVSIADVTARMKQSVPVPDSEDPIWATIDVAPTASGKLFHTVYKSAPLLMRIKLASGVDGDFRFLPTTGDGGFLLSPVINDRVAFALLNSTSWKHELGDSIASRIQIVADTPSGVSSDYDPAYRIHFFSLKFPHADLSAVPGVAEYLGFRQFLFSAKISRSDFGVKLFERENNDKILLAPGRTQITFPALAGAKRMNLAFGVWNSQISGSTNPTAVEFRALLSTRNGDTQSPPRLLWERKLDPVNNPQERGDQHAQIELPDAGSSQIILETTGDAPPSTHYPYWSGVSFR